MPRLLLFFPLLLPLPILLGHPARLPPFCPSYSWGSGGVIVIIPADTEDLPCAGSGPHGFCVCAANREALGYLALAVPVALSGAPLPGWEVGWFP